MSRKILKFIPRQLRIGYIDHSPDEVLRKRLEQRQNASLNFPSNIGEEEQPFYIEFTRFKYKRYRQQDVPTAEVISKIRLPLSTSIVQAYSMQVEDFSTSMGRQIAENAVSNFSASDSFGGKAAAIWDGVKELGSIVKDTAGHVASAGISQGLDHANITGKALNNRAESAFTGVNLKDHAYAFKLIPSSNIESESIEKIIKDFKIGMHPTGDQTSPFLQYPDEYIISFHSNEQENILPSIGDCFLLNCTITYNDNLPKFHVDDKPTSVTIELQFKETNIVTREEIEAGY